MRFRLILTTLALAAALMALVARQAQQHANARLPVAGEQFLSSDTIATLAEGTVILLLALCLLRLGGSLGSCSSRKPQQAERFSSGSITITNPADYPVNVLLRPMSFTCDGAGRQKMLPLDNSVRIVVTESVLWIPAHQTRHVSYRIRSQKSPAWVALHARFVPVNLSITDEQEANYCIYIDDSQPERSELELAAKYPPGDHVLSLRLQNTSAHLARVHRVACKTDEESFTLPGFAVLPGKCIVREVPWTRESVPDLVSILLDSFEMESEVTLQATELVHAPSLTPNISHEFHVFPAAPSKAPA